MITFKNSSVDRLDLLLAKQLEVSRSLSTQLIEKGAVTVDKNVVSKPSSRIREDSLIAVDYVPLSEQVIAPITLTILYEDDDCVVVEKPAGILTHSKGVFNPEATVATFIAPKLTDMEGERGGIVHRLDRVTSGLMICAKNPVALSWLQKQFSQRRTKKTYLAIVEGQLDPAEALIDMPIERNPRKPQTFRVGPNGKVAQTTYKVLNSGDQSSLVELRPKTGRTHQLRVHMANLGHPIVGDTLYGGKPADRVYLHAHSLEITLPNRERKVFTSTMPDDFALKIKHLG